LGILLIRGSYEEEEEVYVDMRSMDCKFENGFNYNFDLPPMPCRKLRGISRHTAVIPAAKEIARCLNEYKYMLILSAVNVLGVNTAIDIFHQTAAIQLSGGEITADGDRKKTPGGVFLSLVKSTASEEECKQIFENDKKIHMKRKILKRKQKSSGIAGQSQALVEGALDVVKLNLVS
jgi:phosphorylated adapter RNA export protein